MKHPFFRLTVILLSILMICMTLPGCAPKPAPAATLNVEEELSRAELLFAQGNYEETILTLETALEMEPANVKGYLRLSDVYIARGEKEKALELLQKGLELTGNQEIADRIQGMTEVVKGIREVSTDGNYTLMLDANGDLYWCGNQEIYHWFKPVDGGASGTTYSQHGTVPKSIQELQNIRQIYACDGNSIAITQDNAMYIWGAWVSWNKNFHNQDYSHPVKVRDNVAQAVTDGYSYLIVDTQGRLYTYGFNHDGELGANLPFMSEYPANNNSFNGEETWYSDQLVLENVSAIAAGRAYYWDAQGSSKFSGTVCHALTKDHKLYAWGLFGLNERDGVLERLCLNEPTLMAEGVKEAAITETELFIITVEGKLKWASLETLGKKNLSAEFHTIDCGNVPMESISCGGDHYLALDALGQLFCGGSNASGQLGMKGDEGDDSYARVFQPIPSARFRCIATGGDTAYAITQGAVLLSWGNNEFGQLANGRLGKQRDEEMPAYIMSGIERVFELHSYANAALSDAGKLYCFGYGNWMDCDTGQVKAGGSPVKVLNNIKSAYEPYYALSKDNKLYSLYSSEEIETNVTYYCSDHNSDAEFIIRTDGSVWGRSANYSGELGNGKKNDRDDASINAPEEYIRCFEGIADVEKVVPVQNDDLELTTYILTRKGELYVCGYDQMNGEYVLSPKKLNTDVGTIVDIIASFNTVYMLNDRNELYLMGGHSFLVFTENKHHSGFNSIPIRIMQNVKKIEDGMLLDMNGVAYTFGFKTYMELIGPDIHEWDESLVPYGINRLICKEIMSGVKDIACSGAAVFHDLSYLLVTEGGDLYAWGNNQYGQLGLGEAGTDENIFEIKLPE